MIMDIKTVTVIGAGTIGADITAVALLAGVEVTLIDISEDLLVRARARIDKGLARRIEEEGLP